MDEFDKEDAKKELKKNYKKAEKLLKNNPTTYTSLTSQYFYGYSSSINLSYTSLA